MKSIILLAISGMIFTACTKEVNTNKRQVNQQTNSAAVENQSERTATLTLSHTGTKGGVEALRGRAMVDYKKGEMAGWILIMESGTILRPLSLASKFQVKNLLVDIVYVYSKQTMPCNCENPEHYVELKDIKGVGSQPN